MEYYVEPAVISTPYPYEYPQVIYEEPYVEYYHNPYPSNIEFGLHHMRRWTSG